MSSLSTMDREQFLKSVALTGLGAGPASALARLGMAHSDVLGSANLMFYWLTLGDPRTMNRFQVLLDRFHRAHPDIAIEQTTPPKGQSFIQKFQALVAAGIPPDLSDTGMDQYSFADRGVFTDVRPLMRRDKLSPSDIYPIAVRSFYDKNKNILYGLPQSMTSEVVYFNKTLFDKARVPYPPQSWDDPTWTWDAYLERAKALTKYKHGSSTPEQFGSGDISGAMFYTAPYMFGGKWLNNQGTAFVIDKPASVRGFQYVQDLFQKYKVAPPASGTNQDLTAAGWYSGTVGMIIDGAWSIAAYRDIKRFTWDVAPMPFAKNLGLKAPRSNPVFPGAFVISSKQSIEQSWALAKFIVDDTANYFYWLSQVEGTFPARRSLTESYLAKIKHTLPIKWDVITSSWDRGSFVEMFMNRNYAEIENFVRANIWQPLAAGNQSAQQIISAQKSNLNQILQP